MGPVTARLLDELGYDPDEGANHDASQGANQGANDSCFPNGWRGPKGSGGVRAAAPALADIDPAAVPVGALLGARDGARAVAVARLGSGRLVVVEDVCPHDGGRISDGFVEGERLVCARHGWELEIEGGRCRRARGAASCGKETNC